jgi:radical SAM/Cys-rich protein
MNAFDQKLNSSENYPLIAKEISTLQINVGYKCNLRCTHCHVEASPDRTEEMSSSTMHTLLGILRDSREITTVDITGGSPELNPNFKHFIRSCSDMGRKTIVRTNLAIYSEPGMEDIPEFLAENRVKIVASLPCYTEDGVDSQRGKGTYEKAIDALKKLNSLGYGKNGYE